MPCPFHPVTSLGNFRSISGNESGAQPSQQTVVSVSSLRRSEKFIAGLVLLAQLHRSVTFLCCAPSERQKINQPAGTINILAPTEPGNLYTL